MGKKKWTRNQKLLLWAIIATVVVGALQCIRPRKESDSVSQETTASNAPFVLVGGDLNGDISIDQKINNEYERLLLEYGDSQRELGSTDKEIQRLKGEITELESELQVAKKREKSLEEKILESKRKLHLILVKQIQKYDLSVIEKPSHLSRSVIHGVGPKVPPLFIGTGYVDYLCGSCQKVLAKQAWPHSISNIVVECPVCKTYNEFTAQPESNYPRVLLSTGNYNFSSHVNIRRDVINEGSSDPNSFGIKR